MGARPHPQAKRPGLTTRAIPKLKVRALPPTPRTTAKYRELPQPVKVTSQDVKVNSQNVRVNSQNVRVTSQGVRVTSQGVRVTSQGVRVTSQSVRKKYLKWEAVYIDLLLTG